MLFSRSLLLPAVIEENLISIIIIAAVLIVLAVVITVAAVRHRRNKKNAAQEQTSEQPVAAAETGESAPEQESVEKKAPAAESVPSEEAVTELPEPAAEIITEPAAEPAAEVQPETVTEVSEGAPASEPAAEAEESVPAAEPVPEKASEPAPASAEPAAEPIPEGAKVMNIVASPGMFIRYRYNRSFEAKLIQSDNTVKRYYSELKNCLLSYKKVTSRISWRHESFRKGRPAAAKFVIRGKTLCLCLALDPENYEESKYIVDDMSRYARFAGTPLMYRIKNERRLRYAKELIAFLFEGTEPSGHEDEDFAAIPYEDTQSLVERGLIKIVSYREVAIEEKTENEEEEFEDDDDFAGEDFDDDDDDELDEINASDVGSYMADDRAKLRVQEGNEVSDRTRSGIVNVDTLGKFFNEGEKVTVAEIKRRVSYFPKNVTYIKVLARGKLDKPLIVVADDFSLEAVKMIVLTGGRAIRTKRK
ncbi:MAG TPA: uL15 family ribosomal protein [Candidatus Coproplasma stercorigallinarum]|nr:uL15 family ribosomal protein [Candidatus Coproplasma stercorigallinarum]